MTDDAKQLIDAALKRVSLSGSFSPVEIGTKAGLSKPQAEAAARALSNAGILVLGFDMAASFSSDYRKLRANDERSIKKENRKRKAKTERRAEVAEA